MKECFENYAPVVIPTLCRYSHLKSCMTSLSKCKYANETVVYIALDFPSKEEHKKGYLQIKEFLPTVTGFKEVIVIEREQNYGAVDNMKNIIDFVFKKHSTLIFSEDDNVFAPGFLTFVNKALRQYESDDKVVSVSGYCYPIDLEAYPQNAFVAPNFSAWGVGYWKDKYYENWGEYVNQSYARLILASVRKSMKIFKQNPRMLARLVTMFWHNQLHTDTMIVASEIVNDRVSLYPKASFVQNHGYDGSGENCWHQELQELFSKQPMNMSEVSKVDVIDLKESELIRNELYNYFNPSTKRTIMTLFAYFALRIGMLLHIR